MAEEDSDAMLKSTLEELAKELAPHYEGKLAVKESKEYFSPKTKEIEVDAAYELAYHVIEEREESFIGLWTVIEEHPVLVVDKRLYGNEAYVLFFNERDRLSIKKHLLPYVSAQKAKSLRLFKMG